MRSSSVFSHLLFLSLGVGAGAFVGVLYAPDKGRNSRGRLTFRLSKYRDRLGELIQMLDSRREAPINTARHEGQRLIEDTRDRAEQLLFDVESLIGQIKSVR
ncbi:MAG: YtxH domain-containing protein [Catalinimonas sp.]